MKSEMLLSDDEILAIIRRAAATHIGWNRVSEGEALKRVADELEAHFEFMDRHGRRKDARSYDARSSSGPQ